MTAAAPQLVTRMQSFHQTRLFGSSSSGGSAEITLSYPEIISAPSNAVGASLTHEISAFVLKNNFGTSRKPVASPQALATSYFADYAEFYASSKQLHIFVQSYFLKRTVRVLSAGPHVIFLRMDEFANTGGAHPNASTLFHNVDAQSGRVLSIDDLIAPGGKASFMRIAERYFRKTRGIPQSQPLSKSPFFSMNQSGVFVLPKSIGVGPDGLIFHYDAYEVASYADGPTEFTIPYSALTSVVRSNLP